MAATRQHRPGSPIDVVRAGASTLAAVATLVVALYVVLAYLVTAGMVATVVALCTAGGWFVMDARGRLDAHRRARAGARAPRRLAFGQAVDDQEEGEEEAA